MFEFDLLDLTDNIEIVNNGKKTIYNTDDKKSLTEYYDEKYDIIDYPKLSSFNNVKECDGGFGMDINSFGVIVSPGNNIQENDKGVRLLTGGNISNHGKVFVGKSDFLKKLLLFTVRKSIKFNWINQKDEYLAPNEEHEQFEQFKYDSLVYSLFHIHSFQSSLRQVEYKDKLWDIKNEFFWMSKDRMKELADENGYDNLYNDARTSSDRHVYNLLFGEERIYDKLSDDARVVLDKATELVEQSLQMRQVMSNDENHLDSWDAGYAQLKLVWKEYFPVEFDEFRQLYKNMEDRMRPLVYELGFLMK
jgi:hypothetical protein